MDMLYRVATGPWRSERLIWSSCASCFFHRELVFDLTWCFTPCFQARSDCRRLQSWDDELSAHTVVLGNGSRWVHISRLSFLRSGTSFVLSSYVVERGVSAVWLTSFTDFQSSVTPHSTCFFDSSYLISYLATSLSCFDPHRRRALIWCDLVSFPQRGSLKQTH